MKFFYAVLAAGLALAALLGPAGGQSAYAQDQSSPSLGLRVGAPSGELTPYFEVFPLPSLSVGVGVGVQSPSLTLVLSLWTAAHLGRLTPTLQPYVGLEGKVLVQRGLHGGFLLLVGVRIDPPTPAVSFSMETAFFLPLPVLNRLSSDIRLAFAVRF